MSVLMYGCITWTLTKHIEKRFDINYTQTLRIVLHKSWKQQPTKQQLYGHLPSITQTIHVLQTRHSWHCQKNKNELISNVLLCTPTFGHTCIDQPAKTYKGHSRNKNFFFKESIIVFSQKYKLYNVWNRKSILIKQICFIAKIFYHKSYFHQAKIFVFRLIKLVTNQTKSSRLK